MVYASGISILQSGVQTTFLKIINLGASATSDAIGAAAAKKIVEESGLNLERLVGIGVDGCSGRGEPQCLDLFQKLLARYRHAQMSQS